MAQEQAWDKEYLDPKLLTIGENPQRAVMRFLKYFRKSQKRTLEGLNVLDLGSGTGKNANYLADLGNQVVGMEISSAAISIAKKRAKEMGVFVEYLKQSIGEKYPFKDKNFEIILDITSSNSLNEAERSVYLSEVNRVLKDDGLFFVRALCKDGDKNAKNLLNLSPGLERDTYIMKELNLIERVFSREDFLKVYGEYFELATNLEKVEGFAKMNGQSYKRYYFIAYFKKKIVC